uniref:Fibrillar collagen NC1 domain-containing protein n=2 Tax=Xiphophorus couchianus TaxID=32473 RepID=A0A3B5LD68_9TELE
MKFLHLLSSEASQRITFHCLGDPADKTKEKFSSSGSMHREDSKPWFIGWNKHTSNTLLEPHLIQDECKIQDGSWHQSHFFFHTQDSRQLPIIDIQEFSSSLPNHRKHLQIGPVCFL